MCLLQVLGVTSDVLFPVQQQREMSELLQKSGLLLHDNNPLTITCMSSCTVHTIASGSYYIIYWVAGNTKTSYYELNSIYGHDTFMLDVNNVGTAVKVRLTTQTNRRHTQTNQCNVLYISIQGHLESTLSL